MKKSDILLTGGHAATTAIATIEEILKSHKDWKLCWVGASSAFEGRKVPTLASVVMPSMGVTYYPITMGRLQRKFTVWTIPTLFKIPIGFIQAFLLVFGLRPRVVVSFGGYISVPVCLASWLLGIPIIIHEQTMAAGLANRITSFFATKVAIARLESKKYFPEKKIVLVGNPVMESIRKVKPKTKIGNPPVIYITGGSSGSQRVNNVVELALPTILKKFKVIHQTGRLDWEHFKKMRSSNYEPHSFIDLDKIASVFEKADIVIGRAGANTVAEIMVTKRPSILIPIPWVTYDEQTKNAKLAQEVGIAVIVKQSDLTPQVLLEQLDFLVKNWQKMVEASSTDISELDIHASGKFVDEIENLLNG